MSCGRTKFASQHHRELAAWAGEQGWVWSRTGSGHLRWDHPAVGRPIFTSSTPRANGMHKERQKLRTALARAQKGAAHA